MLNGSILKRIAAGTGLSISDSGHALTLANTLDISGKQDSLTVNNNVGGVPFLDFNTNEVRKIDTAGDAIVTISQARAAQPPRSPPSRFLAAV